MRIYWEDRDGNQAPSQALFGWRHFSPASSFSFFSPSECERIDRLPPPSHPIAVRKRTFFPSQEEWERGVEKALAAIGARELDKVVLARACVLELAQAPDPFAIAAALRQKAKGAFIFCVELEGTAFLGASPERLFRRQGRTIASEAVAGTRKRGTTADEDERLARELLANDKERREFEFVEASIARSLNPLCESELAFTPRSVIQTPNVQHLFSSCQGVLKKGIEDGQILRCLHPTAALCGSPRKNAFQWIERLEPFERGFYGGAIGWSTPDAAEWAVGLRSCAIRGKTAILYSGTGIVAGSHPLSEWEELNHKIKLYNNIFRENP